MDEENPLAEQEVEEEKSIYIVQVERRRNCGGLKERNNC